MNTVELKRCSRCGEEKPATPEYFHRLRNGLKNPCKACRGNKSQYRDTSPVDIGIEGAIGIPLTQGQIAIIDLCDVDIAEIKWHALVAATYINGGFVPVHTSSGQGGKKRISIHMSCLILERMLGRKLTPGEIADHRNNNPLDNRRSNLRLATRAENNRNIRKPSHNTSGYKGVTFIKKTGKWGAGISVNKKRIHLGYFLTPQEAHEAYCEAAKKYHGEFARFE